MFAFVALVLLCMHAAANLVLLFVVLFLIYSALVGVLLWTLRRGV